MKDKDLIRLQHMLEASRDARSFAEGRQQNDLYQNKMLTMAIIKELEIIGEAAANVSQETRDRFPQIPWADIIGMRNRLVHVYFRINLYVIWSTVQKDLTELIEELEKIPGLK